MKKNQKVFLSIILIAAVIVGGYFVVTSKQPSVPGNTPSNEMTDWKTYRNSQYGFEFKYPDTISLEGPSHVVNTNGESDRISLKNQQNNLVLFLLIGAGSNPNGCFGPSPGLGNYSIAGQIRQKCADTVWYGEKGGWEVTLPITNQNQPSLIYFDCFNGDSRCDQILSTFKFTERARATTADVSNWKTFTSSKDGFEFKYPEELKLSEFSSNVSLSHTLPYKGTACDLSGGFEPDQDLTDFKITFEILPDVVAAPYSDGEYKNGILSGVIAVGGMEGCGDNKYYFPIKGNKTLLITRESIQILSGIRNNAEEREEILSIPGSISRDENQSLFDQILSTFKFTK